jgi:hypothetical protein
MVKIRHLVPDNLFRPMLVAIQPAAKSALQRGRAALRHLAQAPEDTRKITAYVHLFEAATARLSVGAWKHHAYREVTLTERSLDPPA